jgi:hypothetical protein
VQRLYPTPIEPAISISKFCEIENISRTTYYALKKRGEGPDETRAGQKRRTITPEAHRAWRERRRDRADRSESINDDSEPQAVA